MLKAEEMSREKANPRVDHLNTTLETGIEVSLPSSTCQDLSLDDELVGVGCSEPAHDNFISSIPPSEDNPDQDRNSPKDLATLSASAAVNAGRAFGVGIPYYCD